MKKITLAFIASIAVLLGSCESDDNNVEPKKVGVAAKISPPDWILGSWVTGGNNIVKGFIFSNDDMCEVIINNDVLCFKEKIAIYNNAFLKNEVVEDATKKGKYSIEYVFGDEFIDYHFEQIDSLNIQLNIFDLEDPTLIKESVRLARH